MKNNDKEGCLISAIYGDDYDSLHSLGTATLKWLLLLQFIAMDFCTCMDPGSQQSLLGNSVLPWTCQ